MSWKALWAYAYPPPALLPRVLEKAQQDQCELILIAPHWPQAIWFQLLLGMLVQSPLWIPNIPWLLSQPWGQIHRDPSNLQLHAWRISIDFSVDVAFRVSRPQRESTLAIYESKWRIFTVWGNTQHFNPLSATESLVSDFLLYFHTEKYLAISTIALTKPPFEPLDQASDQLLTWKTVFLIAHASGKRRGEIHAFEHARLQRTTGWTQVTLQVGLSFISKTQVLDKGLKCMLSCTIPALDCHLSIWRGWRPTHVPNTGTKILPRKVHALEGAQAPPLCVVQTRT